MKRIIIITAALVVAFTTYELVSRREAESRAETAYTTVTVMKQDLTQSVSSTGIIKPRVGAQVNVGSQISGIVEDLRVEIGSVVKRNALLAEIDPRTFRAKVAQSEAVLDQALTEEKYAGIELSRANALFAKKTIPQQQLDQATQGHELAMARRKQAEADLETARLQLGYTRITAPIDGVVASVATQRGETVAASFASPTFVTIIDLHRLELWAYVDETDIGKVAPGQEVSFTVDAYPGREMRGTVKTIYPDAIIQNNVVNYIVVVSIRETANVILRPQMDANVNVSTECKKGVLVAPKKCVQFDDAGRKFVNVPAGTAMEKRYITTGISDDRFYEVLSGLSAGDAVAVN